MKFIIILLALTLAPSVFAQPQPDARTAAEKAKAQRERAIARCRENRGVDCETDAGLSEWLQQERAREEAETDSSRSIHQTAPKPSPRPGN